MCTKILILLFFGFVVPSSVVSVTTSSQGIAIAGQRYTVSCTVTKQAALLVTPEITWINPNGVEVSGQVNSSSAGNTTISSALLEFNPLMTSHNGLYTCQVSLTSPTLSLPLNSSATAAVTVQSMILKSIINTCIMLSMFLITFLVPQPTVEISTFPESGPFYAGSGLSLRCTFQIDPVVDIPYTVRVDWQKSGVVLIGNDRVSVSNITQQSTHMYLASIDLNPLSTTLDRGVYTCRVTVDVNPPLLHVQRAVHSDSVTVTVQSKCVVSYGV